ncbi:MAG: CRISPR-associated endonuclease Cas3'', partial [Agriterribacter sp.]
MSSFYDTVAAILKTTPPLHTFLEGCNRYYAHVSPKNAVHPLSPETLQEHIELVLEKLSLIVSQHGLDTVIDNLILDFLKVHNLQNDLKLGQFIKRLFVNTIVFHDFGKVNENFQASYRKMNNAYFKGKENRQSVLSTRHSGLGAYLFIVKSISEAKEKLGPKSQAVVMATILMFAYPIFKHHSKYLNDEYIDTISFSPEEVNCMKRYISHYQFNIHQQFVEILPAHLKKAFKDLQGAEVFNSFSLYSLVKLNFSLLTASDYLATSQYMSGNKLVVNDLGVLTVERILQIFDFVSKSEFLNAPHLKKRNYNRETYEKINEGFQLENPKTVGNDHLNKLRQEMAFEVILNVRKNSYKNLFYIEAPTGGGKTNLSMLAVVELLKANEGRINKVFYVFPFTTLITQTYTTIKETLGLRDSEIIQLHSKAGYKEKEEKGEEEKEDGLYSDEKENYIHNLFTHYPFSLLSHIKFFDLLKTNEKEANYLLHRIANSIVVIDELQSYDPAHWDKIIYFITQYAQLYNIRFVLMSATLPKLGDLKVLERPYTDEFVYLLPNAKQDYFLNPNFSERVKFNFDLFERQNLTLTEISEKVLAESQKYALLDFGTLKPANSVYCIIEFIFKKTATDFYQIVEGLNNSFFDEILVLSGTILEHRRKEIINLLKSPEARRKKILLVT